MRYHETYYTRRKIYKTVLDFETVFRYLMRLYKNLEGSHDLSIYDERYQERSQGVFRRQDLLTALGYKGDSGRSRTVISSLIGFGLLDKDVKRYSFSQQAKILLAGTTAKSKWRETALECITAPIINKTLFDKYKADVSRDAANYIASIHNLWPRDAQQIVRNYAKGIRFVLAITTALGRPPLADR